MTKVRFFKLKYGNYLDRYYRDDYDTFVENLYNTGSVEEESRINLGITDGIMINNTFKGDFTQFNCAVILRDGKYDFYRIVRKTFIRKDMWHLTMKKDIISAEYDNIVESDILVSRLGLDTKVFDPLLFMDEGMNLSQVKKTSIPLTEVNGIKSYGYLALFTRDTLSKGEIEWKPSHSSHYVPDIIISGETPQQWVEGKYEVFEKTFIMRIHIKDNLGRYHMIAGEGQYANTWEETNTIVVYEPNFSPGPNETVYHVDSSEGIETHYHTIFQRLWLRHINGKVDYPNEYPEFRDTVGKTIKEEFQQDVYKISEKSSITGEDVLHDATLTVTVLNDYFTVNNVENFTDSYHSLITGVNKLNLTLLIAGSAEINLGVFSKMNDQPFEAFFVPMVEGNIKIVDNEGITNYKFNKELIENMMFDLISDYGGENAKLIDVQILPYSPNGVIRNSITEYAIPEYYLDDNIKHRVVMEDGSIILFYPVNESKIRTVIGMSGREGTEWLLKGDYKTRQLYQYRFTNPSGSENYLFDVNKNDGLDFVYIDTNIRPYASYFQLQPRYKSMYGTNYVDTRGLIWQEDMSLTQVSSAWETYKRQNVNYMESFLANENYEISHRSLVHETNRGNFRFDSGKRMIEAAVDSATHVAETTAMDAWFGVKGGISGGVGAAAIMTGQAAMEGIEKAQMEYNIKKDLKSLDMGVSLRRKQFNFDIGNMKAIPENVNKVSGLFTSNELVPYLQVSGPTEEEFNNYEKYIELNGCNIGLVVNLSEKIFNYIQGTIMKYNSPLTMEEYTELDSQLNQGVRKMEGELE